MTQQSLDAGMPADESNDVPVVDGPPVSRDDVREIVESMMSSLQGELTSTDIQLYAELASLSQFIDAAKQDIVALRPDEVTDDYIPTASNELDAIVDATAEATNAIMDATEIVEGVAADLDSEMSERLMEQTTAIFEACGFQDITGQRITKVVKALQGIDEKVHRLVDAFGHEFEQLKAAHQKDAPEEDRPLTDDDLLNGPQTGGAANTQDEIDALLASFD